MSLFPMSRQSNQITMESETYFSKVGAKVEKKDISDGLLATRLPDILICPL